MRQVRFTLMIAVLLNMTDTLIIERVIHNILDALSICAIFFTKEIFLSEK